MITLRPSDDPHLDAIDDMLWSAGFRGSMMPEDQTVLLEHMRKSTFFPSTNPLKYLDEPYRTYARDNFTESPQNEFMSTHLSQQEKEALKDYIKDHRVYDYLRDGKKIRGRTYANYAFLIDMVFRRIPPLSKDMIVYRSVTLPASTNATNVLEMLNNHDTNGYVSTSASYYQDGHYNSASNFMLIIRISAGQCVIPLTSLCLGEEEHLLDRQGHFEQYRDVPLMWPWRIDRTNMEPLPAFYLTYIAHTKHAQLRIRPAPTSPVRHQVIKKGSVSPVTTMWWTDHRELNDSIRATQ